MRIITHNMLICNKKGCAGNNFPLKIVSPVIDKREVDFNPEFIKKILPSLVWSAIVSAANDMKFSVPAELPHNVSEDEALLRNVHEVLNEIQVSKAQLVCPNCSRVYPIENGIPNMLLNEDEV